MKKNKLAIAALIALWAAILTIIGCTTKNPAYTPPPPGQTTTVPQYIPDPRIASLSNTVAQVAQGVSPVNPYAGLTDYAVKGVFGLAGLIAGAVAGVKNRNAVINTMAAGVIKAGAAQPVLDHASNTGNFAAVADAINAQTGANQTPTGAPKT